MDRKDCQEDVTGGPAAGKKAWLIVDDTYLCSYNPNMYRTDVLDLDDAEVDPGQLARLIDTLQTKLCRVVAAAARRGEHSLTGQTPVSWVAETCKMSKTSASDRLCVGAQLESLASVEQAVTDGRIGYQAASVICHLSDQLGEKRELIDQEQWVGYASRFSIKALRYLALSARHAWDPEGFDKDAEQSYEERYLFISEMRGMYKLDGLFDAEAGAALKTAIDSLAKPLGAHDTRTARQRRADAITEMAHHAMDAGTLPRRNGVRPHITLTTTIEGLKGELGAAASELEHGTLVSSKTAQRLACDGTLTRVLKAGSVVTDVGRATRAVSPSTRRALTARDKGCRWPGCDRPSSWSSAHHIQFVRHSGPTNLPNLVLVCHHHHRLVHEGGWQVIRVGDAITFLPPDRLARAA